MRAYRAATQAIPGASAWRGLSKHRAVGTAFAIAVVMFVITSVNTPGFAAPAHLRFLLISASFIGLVGLGQTFVIIGGGVDLSVPYTITTVGMLTALWAGGQNSRLVWVLPAVLGIAAFIGLVNGVGVAYLGISPIIMTLGMNVVVEGFLGVYLGYTQPGSAPPFIGQIGSGTIGQIPIATLLWLGGGALATLALSLMVFGKRLYAAGSSQVVSQLSGINIARTRLATYVISGIAAGLAGLALTGYTGQAYLGMGDPYLFASVAAVAIGGAPLLGGGGNYIGTIAGALVLTMLAGLLPVLNLDPGWTDIVYGLTIIITVSVATAGRRADRA